MTVNHLRYALISIILMIVMAVLSVLLNHWFKFAINSAAQTVIPPVIAAFYEGRSYGRNTREPMRQIWSHAFTMTATTMIINVFGMGVALTMIPQTEAFISRIAPYILAILAVLCVVWFFTNWLGMQLGIRAARRSTDRGDP